MALLGGKNGYRELGSSSNYGTFRQQARRAKRSKFCRVCCSVCVLFLLAGGLCGFFLYPREPTTTQNGVTVQQFILTPFEMELNGQLQISVKNSNYVDIDILSISLALTDVRSGIDVGSISDSNKVALKRQTTNLELNLALWSNVTNVCQTLFNEFHTFGFLTFRIHGPIDVSYLGIKVTQNMDTTQQLVPISS